MNEEELRAAFPPERHLPVDRRDNIKEMLMEAFQEESSPAAPASRRPRRRRLAGGAAVAVVVAAFGTAAAAAVLTRDRPDPHEAAVINEEMGSRSPAAGVHLEGWRPELSSETVRCVLPEGVIETWASEFPLEDLLTTEAIVQECASGNDLAGNSAGGVPAASASVCATDGTYPMPVVLLDGSTCDNQRQLRTFDDEDLAELNRLRAFDVSVLAVPSEDGCPTADQAMAWAKGRIRELGRSLAVNVMDEGDACYRGVTDWSRRVVIVQAVGPQTAAP